MICSKCKRIGVLHAFSEGKCQICGKPTVTPHIPSFKVCATCSASKKLCEQCGEKIK